MHCSTDIISGAREGTIVDGVNLDEIREFAKQFKIRRLSLGLTQTQVGQALSATEGPSYSQSAICRSVCWSSLCVVDLRPRHTTHLLGPSLRSDACGAALIENDTHLDGPSTTTLPVLTGRLVGPSRRVVGLGL